VTPRRSNETEKYLIDQEFAALLGISVVRLRNKISAGEPLPPYIQPPGCRKRLWNRDQVEEWLTRYTIRGQGCSRLNSETDLRQSVGRSRSNPLSRP